VFVAVLLGLLAIGIAIGLYAILAPRRREAVEAASPAVPAESHPPQTEAQRVDAVFAMGALDGAESTRRLTAALDDPSETVALAAAHALAGSGRSEIVRAYVATHPDDRTARLRETIAWMHADSGQSGI
jgi:HEAT repeat protein